MNKEKLLSQRMLHDVSMYVAGVAMVGAIAQVPYSGPTFFAGFAGMMLTREIPEWPE